jgi:acetyl-CoA synthetase
MEVVNPIVARWRKEGLEDPVSFWARAAEQAFWFRTWDDPFVWEPPTFRWFVGGLTNLSYAALDRHVSDGQGGRAALIAETEWGERSTFTYAQLWRFVRRLAASLRGLGIRRGDRIGIYMPTCPEAIALMLAATRIGAIHIVVFAGFGAGALADRLSWPVLGLCSPLTSPGGAGAKCGSRRSWIRRWRAGSQVSSTSLSSDGGPTSHR